MLNRWGKYISAGMMADGGDEALQITRYFDAGDKFQLVGMASDLHAFVLALDYMFVKRPAGCLELGYTHFAVKNLGVARLFHVNGKAKTLGGPGKVTVAMLGRCLSRMAGWARLSIQSVNAEYPSWHLLLSFQCFRIVARERQITGDHGFGNRFNDECFQRLAAAFGGTTAAMSKAHGDHFTYARAHFIKNPSEGWAQACIAALSRPSGVRLPLDNGFRSSVHSLQAWDGFTTSPLERGFSALSNVVGKHRDCLDDISQGQGDSKLAACTHCLQGPPMS